MMAGLRAEAKAIEECGCSTELFALPKPKWMGCYLRFVLVRANGRDWYGKRFTSPMSPLTLAALLFTIGVMFSNQPGSRPDRGQIRLRPRTAMLHWT